MLSKESLLIVGCEQDEQGYWMPDNDGDFDYITEHHIVGKLTEWLLDNGCDITTTNGSPKLFMINIPNGLTVFEGDLITALDTAVQQADMKG